MCVFKIQLYQHVIITNEHALIISYSSYHHFVILNTLLEKCCSYIYSTWPEKDLPWIKTLPLIKGAGVLVSKVLNKRVSIRIRYLQRLPSKWVAHYNKHQSFASHIFKLMFPSPCIVAFSVNQSVLITHVPLQSRTRLESHRKPHMVICFQHGCAI